MEGFRNRSRTKNQESRVKTHSLKRETDLTTAAAINDSDDSINGRRHQQHQSAIFGRHHRLHEIALCISQPACSQALLRRAPPPHRRQTLISREGGVPGPFYRVHTCTTSLFRPRFVPRYIQIARHGRDLCLVAIRLSSGLRAPCRRRTTNLCCTCPLANMNMPSFSKWMPP